VGRIANALNRGIAASTVSASAIQAPGQIWTDQQQMQTHDVPRALDTNEIARIADDFATAAKNAIDVGFDGVELHSANGYLLMQFLSSNVNRRTDRYGGSIENRARMPLEVLEAIVAKVPRERVGVRISPGHQFNGIEEAEMADLYAHYIGRLNGFDLAYLHVMRPFANKIADDTVGMARRAYKGKLIACGGYDGASGAALLQSGGADVIAFGSAFIANPDLVERIRTGKALSAPDQSTFYTPGEKGYTDYPAAA
jgi:N-ethylmaleimide reductase